MCFVLQQEVIQESIVMVPDTKRKLDAAHKELQKMIVSFIYPDSNKHSERCKTLRKLAHAMYRDFYQLKKINENFTGK